MLDTFGLLCVATHVDDWSVLGVEGRRATYSPEQLRGLPARRGRQRLLPHARWPSHALTGEPPYHRRHDRPVMYAHLVIPPPSAERAGVSELGGRLDAAVSSRLGEGAGRPGRVPRRSWSGCSPTPLRGTPAPNVDIRCDRRAVTCGSCLGARPCGTRQARRSVRAGAARGDAGSCAWTTPGHRHRGRRHGRRRGDRGAPPFGGEELGARVRAARPSRTPGSRLAGSAAQPRDTSSPRRGAPTAQAEAAAAARRACSGAPRERGRPPARSPPRPRRRARRMRVFATRGCGCEPTTARPTLDAAGAVDARRRGRLALARLRGRLPGSTRRRQLGFVGVPPGVRRAGCALISMLAVLGIRVAARAGRARGQGGRRAVAGRRRQADHLQGRPVQRRPRARTRSATAPINERPQVDGYITRIKPNLTYLDGTRAAGRRDPPAPRRLGEHLAPEQRGLRLRSSSSPRARRRRRMQLPKGYGYPLKATDGLLLNHMIHNLTPTPTQVYMTYQIDFVPKGSRAARGIRPVRPIWMDVQSGQPLPGLQRAQGLRPEGPLHLSGRRPEPVRRRPEAEPVGRGQAGRARRDRRPPAPRRAPHRPEACARQAAGPRRLFRSRREVLRARGRRVVGRGDDRSRGTTGG